MPDTIIVVPCYNEAARLDVAELLALVDQSSNLELLFVNDGSKDGTETRLLDLQTMRPKRIDVLSLATNQGKAEAVRQGLLRALSRGADVVGYIDADLSTPVSEVLRLCQAIRTSGASVVMGTRVALLGSDIQRQVARHYLGRIFASVASLMLKVRVYDTQCGAKFVRRSPTLAAALSEPFLSRWAFDVELLGRLLAGAPSIPGLHVRRFLEVPLKTWRDVPGSKLGRRAMVQAARDLAIVGADLQRRRLGARTALAAAPTLVRLDRQRPLNVA